MDDLFLYTWFTGLWDTIYATLGGHMLIDREGAILDVNTIVDFNHKLVSPGCYWHSLNAVVTQLLGGEIRNLFWGSDV